MELLSWPSTKGSHSLECFSVYKHGTSLIVITLCKFLLSKKSSISYTVIMSFGFYSTYNEAVDSKFERGDVFGVFLRNETKIQYVKSSSENELLSYIHGVRYPGTRVPQVEVMIVTDYWISFLRQRDNFYYSDNIPTSANVCINHNFTQFTKNTQLRRLEGDVVMKIYNSRNANKFFLHRFVDVYSKFLDEQDGTRMQIDDDAMYEQELVG
jgi:hypothetical protein